MDIIPTFSLSHSDPFFFPLSSSPSKFSNIVYNHLVTPKKSTWLIIKSMNLVDGIFSGPAIE